MTHHRKMPLLAIPDKIILTILAAIIFAGTVFLFAALHLYYKIDALSYTDYTYYVKDATILDNGQPALTEADLAKAQLRLIYEGIIPPGRYETATSMTEAAEENHVRLHFAAKTSSLTSVQD